MRITSLPTSCTTIRPKIIHTNHHLRRLQNHARIITMGTPILDRACMAPRRVIQTSHIHVNEQRGPHPHQSIHLMSVACCVRDGAVYPRDAVRVRPGVGTGAADALAGGGSSMCIGVVAEPGGLSLDDRINRDGDRLGGEVQKKGHRKRQRLEGEDDHGCGTELGGS